MTEVIVYALDIWLILEIIIVIPLLFVICEFLYYDVRDRWIRRDYKLLKKLNKELEIYDNKKWEMKHEHIISIVDDEGNEA